ncbi:MAG: hypothetical protein DBX66_04435 [Clostridiales bacterium]|uniref:hypothetical protein n=1 Tax=Oscillospiraceae TaxID=216572 RepID=UPI0009A87EE1|nr:MULTISPECIES: hypothetical protein [Oscillospiraceae]PWM37992.1 MAG: hypothetical protein DBX66_04435 [Clostridiales bacterium]RGB68246.1 hypothetical protein DW086_04665 [Harryflintia acetispora]
MTAWTLAALLLALLMAQLCLWRRGEAGRLALALCAPDDDVKIAPDYPSAGLRARTDTGESVAQEYTRHKLNGNIFMANRLGEELARPLLCGAGSSLFDGVSEENIGQLYFMYGFAVRVAVAQGVENTILADTVRHSFSETVEDHNEHVYDALNDSVSDTVYRLCLADNQCLGNCFAKLCNHDGDSRWIELGMEAYERYYQFAAGLIGKFEFK